LQSEASIAEILQSLSNSDPVVRHTAIHALAHRKAHRECFASLDSDNCPSQPLLQALAMMHEPAVVEGVIA